MKDLIKLKTDIKAYQSAPYIQKIVEMDGLNYFMIRDYNFALNKFRMILLICEQNGLQYWVNRDFRIANEIYNKIIKQEDPLDFWEPIDLLDTNRLYNKKVMQN